MLRRKNAIYFEGITRKQLRDSFKTGSVVNIIIKSSFGGITLEFPVTVKVIDVYADLIAFKGNVNFLDKTSNCDGYILPNGEGTMIIRPKNEDG
jgi:hypothetical protein